MQAFEGQPALAANLDSVAKIVLDNLADVKTTCMGSIERLDASHDHSHFQALAGDTPQTSFNHDSICACLRSVDHVQPACTHSVHVKQPSGLCQSSK